MTKVRYKPSLAIGIFLLGGLLAMSMSSAVLAGLTILEAGVIALAFYSRPYLIIENNRAAFVSLISNKIKKEITAEELAVKSGGMRWFLRESDFGQLGQFLKNHAVQ